MRSLQWSSVLLSLIALAQSLQIVPEAAQEGFPACGVNCAVFQQVQATCGPQTPNLAAENCFCQSQAVQVFYASADYVCPTECPDAADRAALRNWFTSFCGQVGSGNDPLATNPTQTGTTPASTATFRPGPANKDNETGSAWFKDHWQWILMVIVLVIGLTAIAFLLRWLRNRHRAKVVEKSKPSSKRASTRLSEILMSPTEKPKQQPSTQSDGLWGPHQHMAASQGYQYDMEHGQYPHGGARADPWRTENGTPSKSVNQGTVQVTEIEYDHPDGSYYAPQVSRRAENREYTGDERYRHAR